MELNSEKKTELFHKIQIFGDALNEEHQLHLLIKHPPIDTSVPINNKCKNKNPHIALLTSHLLGAIWPIIHSNMLQIKFHVCP